MIVTSQWQAVTLPRLVEPARIPCVQDEPVGARGNQTDFCLLHPCLGDHSPILGHPALVDGSCKELEQRYGEKFSLATEPILPLDNYPGDATALQVLSDGRMEAVAEPLRLFGGSALAVHPSR